MMKNKLFGKLNKNDQGFSIAEMLIVVLILLMVSGVVAGGMPVAARAYKTVVDSSNAQLLLSTTVTTLREELGEASDVVCDSSARKFTYTNTTGGASEIEFKTDGVYITSANVNAGNSRPLVSNKAAAGMIFGFAPGEETPVSYNSTTGIVTLKSIVITRGGETTPLASLDSLNIKVIGK